MHPHRLPTTTGWQSELRQAVRTIDELAALLDLPPAALGGDTAAAQLFPLLVPRGFVARMRAGDPSDPLLRQILPAPQETLTTDGYVDDPLGESAYAEAGVIRKYATRTLVVSTAACPVHCRYCFRRAFPYRGHNAAADDWSGTLERLAAETGTNEVILSGGDPLSLADSRLERLLERIAELEHIDTIRIHTRFPVMIPARVTPELVRMLGRLRTATVVVVHTNHPQEIDDGVAHALRALRGCTTALLNQSVLLRDINDDTATLVELSRKLWHGGVLPYYLHMLDHVSGTAHFAVADATAVALVDAMRPMLPGYLVPRLVREIPGRLSKTAII